MIIDHYDGVPYEVRRHADFDITRPGVYAVTSFGLWAQDEPSLPARTSHTFTAALPGRYNAMTGELVRVAADPPIFPHMRLR